MPNMANQKNAAKPQSSPKKKPASKPAPAAPAGTPLVDPAQSTAAAAALVANKVAAPASSPAPKAESSTFRNMKESLTKPHSQTIGGVLDKLAPSGQKRSGLPYSGAKQVGHNQTFGADVTRRNVPRRTNG
jgi:hypothetical protein